MVAIDWPNFIAGIFASLVVGIVLGIALEKWMYQDATDAIHRIYK